jgi:hypothetical protein
VLYLHQYPVESVRAGSGRKTPENGSNAVIISDGGILPVPAGIIVLGRTQKKTDVNVHNVMLHLVSNYLTLVNASKGLMLFLSPRMHSCY